MFDLAYLLQLLQLHFFQLTHGLVADMIDETPLLLVSMVLLKFLLYLALDVLTDQFIQHYKQ